MQDAAADDYVERVAQQAGKAEVRLDEARGHAVARRRVAGQLQRGAGEVGSDDGAIRAGEKQAQLAGSAAHFQHGSISGNGCVEQAGEFAAACSRAQRRQAVARRISGEGRVRIEVAYRLGARVGRQAQIRNSAWRCVLHRARGAAQLAQRTRAARTRQQLLKRLHTRTARALPRWRPPPTPRR